MGTTQRRSIGLTYNCVRINTFAPYLLQMLFCRLEDSLPADVLWGSFVTHSFLPVGEKWMRDKRTLKDVCGEAT